MQEVQGCSGEVAWEAPGYQGTWCRVGVRVIHAYTASQQEQPLHGIDLPFAIQNADGQQECKHQLVPLEQGPTHIPVPAAEHTHTKEMNAHAIMYSTTPAAWGDSQCLAKDC